MNRIKDYSGFAAWFVGLGYIVLWPLTTSSACSPSIRASAARTSSATLRRANSSCSRNAALVEVAMV